MKQQLIAVTGFAGSGKDLIGTVLVNNFSFKKDSFANPLKDSCAHIFSWPRHMLEGDTQESREWRELEDKWWAERLAMPGFCPRKALQLIGTEGLRHHFHNGIWLLSLENRFIKQNNNIVVTDCRFRNELNMVLRLGGKVIQVDRGPRPEWWDYAAEANAKNDQKMFKHLEEDLKIHASEYSWIGFPVDVVIDNDGTIEDLNKKVNLVVQEIFVNDT